MLSFSIKIGDVKVLGHGGGVSGVVKVGIGIDVSQDPSLLLIEIVGVE